MFTLSLLSSLPSAYLEVVLQFLNFSSTQSVLMKYVTCNGIAEIPCQSNSQFGGSSKKGGLPIKLNFSAILVEAGEREKNWNDHFHFSAACQRTLSYSVIVNNIVIILNRYPSQNLCNVKEKCIPSYSVIVNNIVIFILN